MQTMDLAAVENEANHGVERGVAYFSRDTIHHASQPYLEYDLHLSRLPPTPRLQLFLPPSLQVYTGLGRPADRSRSTCLTMALNIHAPPPLRPPSPVSVSAHEHYGNEDLARPPASISRLPMDGGNDANLNGARARGEWRMGRRQHTYTAGIWM